MDSTTFAAFLTAAGAGIAATIVTTFISVIKTALPPVADWNGALMAFVLTAILYTLTGYATGVATLDVGLNVFIAWLTCATTAVGVHKLLIKPAIERVQARQDSGNTDIT